MITDRENDTIYYLAQRQKKHEQEQEIQSWRQGQSIPCFLCPPNYCFRIGQKDLTRVADYCLYGMKLPVSTTHKILKEEFVSFF